MKRARPILLAALGALVLGHPVVAGNAPPEEANKKAMLEFYVIQPDPGTGGERQRHVLM